MPGQGTIRVSVLDPTDGLTMTDVRTILIEQQGKDDEPNDTPALAVKLSERVVVSGMFGGDDPRDLYRLETREAGTVVIDARILTAGAAPSRVTILDSNGTEEGTFTISGSSERFEVGLGAGTHYLQMDNVGSPASYAIEYEAIPTAPNVTRVDPATGPPGTIVTIGGNGFSTELARNRVKFGGIFGEVVFATESELRVVVPVDAVSAPIEVTVGTLKVKGPVFDTGIAGPPPTAIAAPPNLESMMADPETGEVVSASRLLIRFRSGVSRAEVDTLVTPLGGAIIGRLPARNEYQIQFGTKNLYELESVRRVIELAPQVVTTTDEVLMMTDGVVDSEARASGCGGFQCRWSGDLIKLFSAYRHVEAVRKSFTTPPDFTPVNVAILDTGLALNKSLAFKSEFSGVQTTFWNLNVVPPEEVSSPDRYFDVSVGTVEGGPDGIVGKSERDPAGEDDILILPGPDGRLNTSDDVSIPATRRDEGPDEEPHTGDDTFPVWHVTPHGSMVASVLAARNNRTGISGIITGLYARGVPPSHLTLTVYARGHIKKNHDVVVAETVAVETNVGTFATLDTLTDLIGDNDVKIVNMSFACMGVKNVRCSRERFQEAFDDMPEVLFIAAAGNDGVSASTRLPASLTNELENVMSVAGVAPSTEFQNRVDARAKFRKGSSNFGPLNQPPGSGVIDIAAPGIVAAAGPAAGVISDFTGTSAATPVVAGVAAILYSLEGMSPELRDKGCQGVHRPGCIKRILKETADDISAMWQLTPGACGPRLGDPGSKTPCMLRLNALAAVVRVLDQRQPRYERVLVADEDATEPMTGASGGRMHPLAVAPMTGERVVGRESILKLTGRPRAVVGSGDGLRGYVSMDGSPGRVAIINMRDGMSEPSVGLESTVETQGTTAGVNLALSADGRHVFGSAGRRLYLIDTETGESVNEIPSWKFVPNSDPAKPPTLVQEPVQLVTKDAEGRRRLFPLDPPPDGCVFCHDESILGRLTVSSDGARLYVVVRNGRDQEGGVLELEAGLPDVDTNMTGVQQDASKFLRVVGALPPAGTQHERGREPVEAAVSPDGQHLYVAQRGFGNFVLMGTAGRDVEAPGLIGPYRRRLITHEYKLEREFHAGVYFGWGLGSDDVNADDQVYARRPHGIAIRPDGNRALMPFFQSGNFGVLDVDGQKRFPNATSDADMFRGTVAVTPSVDLDDGLWPKRGDDVRLLFPTEVRYSQNGRFAVAVHGGSSGHADCKEKPEEKRFCTQEGEVSVIKDDDISEELEANIDRFGNFFLDPYYAVFPLCQTVEPRVCVGEVMTRLSVPPNLKFRKPVGVAIQPIVAMLAPHTGENVWRTAPLVAQWRTAPVEITQVIFSLTKWFRGEAQQQVPVGTRVSLALPAFGAWGAKAVVDQVLRGSNPPGGGVQPQDGDVLELTVSLCGLVTAPPRIGDPCGFVDREVSRTSVRVTYRENG